MKRRTFLKSSIQASLGVLGWNAAQAAPCNPPLSGAPNPACPSTGSVLADAAAGLSAGQWTSFTAPPGSIGQFGISWQNRTAFWDAARGELHFATKAQGGGAAGHHIYTEASDSWRTVNSNIMPGSAGHAWTVSFDHDTGDYYWLDFEAVNYLDYYERASNTWKKTSTASFSVQNGSSKPSTAIAFHPNLYGPGDAGVLVWGVTDLAAWRKSTNTWESLRTFGSGSYWNRRNAPGLYIPGWDRIIMGCGITNTQQALIMDAGANGSVATTSPALENLPIRVQGNASTSSSAMMLLDPRNNSTIMLLERSGGRVWTNSSGGDGSAWTLEPYTHPFWANLNVYRSAPDYGSWTCGSVSTYGVVWGMATYGGSESILWRPGS